MFMRQCSLDGDKVLRRYSLHATPAMLHSCPFLCLIHVLLAWTFCMSLILSVHTLLYVSHPLVFETYSSTQCQLSKIVIVFIAAA